MNSLTTPDFVKTHACFFFPSESPKVQKSILGRDSSSIQVLQKSFSVMFVLACWQTNQPMIQKIWIAALVDDQLRTYFWPDLCQPSSTWSLTWNLLRQLETLTEPSKSLKNSSDHREELSYNMSSDAKENDSDLHHTSLKPLRVLCMYDSPQVMRQLVADESTAGIYSLH